MEANTATISLSRYDKLKGYEELVQNSRVIYGDPYTGVYRSLTEEEFSKELKQENEILKNEVKRLEKSNRRCIERFRCMGLVSFITWRTRVRQALKNR